jgi:hypothetical protein
MVRELNEINILAKYIKGEKENFPEITTGKMKRIKKDNPEVNNLAKHIMQNPQQYPSLHELANSITLQTESNHNLDDPFDDVAHPAIYSAITSDPGEPTTFEEAINGPEKEMWRKAIMNEIQNFMKRKVWMKVNRNNVVEKLKRKPITTKWVFKKKIEADKSIRYKARCVARGFQQIPGVDFTEYFAPVAADTSIRVTIAIFMYYHQHNPGRRWRLETFDVEAAFLNAIPSHTTYIEWPKGMTELGLISKEEARDSCAELTKAMYGNIDAPLQWMRTFASLLTGSKMKMKQSQTDPCIFYKLRDGKLVLILVLYVDDTLCAGEQDEIEWACRTIQETYPIERLGWLKKHLGVWYNWKKDEQGRYIEAQMPGMVKDIIDKYTKATGKPPKHYDTPGAPGKTLKKNQGPAVNLEDYRSIVGKIMYYATKLCPDISNAV